MRAEDIMVCIGCSKPREIDQAKSKPGEEHYTPCPDCGPGVGIRRQNDRYQQIHHKKPNIAPYEKSPYRGGKPRV